MKTRKPVIVQGYPIQIEGQYLRAIDRMFNHFDNEVKTEIRKHVDYRRATPYVDNYRMDGIKDIMTFIRNLSSQFEKHPAVTNMSQTTSNIIESIHNFSAKLTKLHWQNKLLKGLGKVGINVKKPAGMENIFRLPNLKSTHIKPIAEKNVQLIQKQGKKYLAKIQSTIVKNITQGKSQKELAEALQKATKVERNKAKFWASDQLGKAFSAINRRNAIGAGFEYYIWRTQKDGRVRDKHAHFEGKKFRYDDPPISDSGEPINPGDDYNCRCFPENVMEYTPPDTKEEREKAQAQIARKKEAMGKNKVSDKNSKK